MYSMGWPVSPKMSEAERKRMQQAMDMRLISEEYEKELK